MKFKLPRLKSLYRQEPVSAFIVTFGAVDAILGGFGERWTLLSFGLMLVILGVILRWVQSQKEPKAVLSNPPRRYLPPSSNPTQPLPILRKKQDYR